MANLNVDNRIFEVPPFMHRVYITRLSYRIVSSCREYPYYLQTLRM